VFDIVSWPGFDFASAMSSFTFLAGTDGCTARRLGAEPTSVYRRQIMFDAVRDVRMQPRIDREAVRGHEQRVAVRCRARDGFCADEAITAGTIVDEELLTHCLGKALRETPREDVRAARGRERHDHAHRLRGVLLRIRVSAN
jgi:hypothetical protein